MVVNERQYVGRECGMIIRSANPGRGAPMGFEECYHSREAPKWGRR